MLITPKQEVARSANYAKTGSGHIWQLCQNRKLTDLPTKPKEEWPDLATMQNRKWPDLPATPKQEVAKSGNYGKTGSVEICQISQNRNWPGVPTKTKQEVNRSGINAKQEVARSASYAKTGSGRIWIPSQNRKWLH